MREIKKAQPRQTGVSLSRTFLSLLQGEANRCILIPSKQSAVAMTTPAMWLPDNSLYTKPIANRNLIVFYYALVSPKHCESVGIPWMQPFKNAKFATQKSCCTNRVTPRTTRQPNWNHVDRGNLVQHTANYHAGKGGCFN